jgi:hypothetical protein
VITNVITKLLAVVNTYKFYYVDGSVVTNPDLLLDPLKEIKAHMYFADNLRLTDLFKYLNTFLMTEFTFIKAQLGEDEEIDMAYFIALNRHVKKLLERPLEQYDEVKIPGFYQGD